MNYILIMLKFAGFISLLMMISGEVPLKQFPKVFLSAVIFLTIINGFMFLVFPTWSPFKAAQTAKVVQYDQ